MLTSHAKRVKGKIIPEGVYGEVDIKAINKALLDFAMYRTINGLIDKKEAAR